MSTNPHEQRWSGKILHHLRRVARQKHLRLREAKQRTQEQIAEGAGVSWRYLQELEAGKGTNPSLTVLCGLKTALDCSWDDLLVGVL